MKRFLILVAVILLAAIIAYTTIEDTHDFSDSECQKCHVDSENNPKELTASVSKLCGICHRNGMKTASHPVDIFPETTKIPSDMPLSRGKLTCNTCHNPHAKRFNAFGEKSYFLRRTAIGREFCISCHEADPVKQSHKDMFDSAHLGRKFRSTNPSKLLDKMSVDCISCHDGTTGQAVDFSYGEGVWRHNLTDTHPIGVSYEESRMKDGSLKPISKLSKKLHFFGGRIGCGTCHDPYSKLPAQLVMTNENSRLCTECHFDK